MSFNFLKHPKDMNKDELFKMQQEIQKAEKARGGHFPLEVNARPANGEPATVKDMHEDATRKQLTNYYEQTAMAGLPDAAKGIKKADTIHDAANEFAKGIGAMRKVSEGKGDELDELDKQKGRSGMLESDFRKNISNDPRRIKSFKEGEAEYKAHRNKLK